MYRQRMADMERDPTTDPSVLEHHEVEVAPTALRPGDDVLMGYGIAANGATIPLMYVNGELVAPR